MVYLHQHNVLHCDLAARNISSCLLPCSNRNHWQSKNSPPPPLWLISLTPLYLLLASDGKVRLSEFGLSRWDGSITCRLSSTSQPLLKVRWTAPEVIKDLYFTKHAEVWWVFMHFGFAHVVGCTMSNPTFDLWMNFVVDIPIFLY